MWEVMNACICLDNMIIKSERINPPNDNHRNDFVGPLATIDHDVPADSVDFLAMHAKIRNVDAHMQLQNDKVEHLWRIKGHTKAIMMSLFYLYS
jgi:hypothetical protein